MNDKWTNKSIIHSIS